MKKGYSIVITGLLLIAVFLLGRVVYGEGETTGWYEAYQDHTLQRDQAGNPYIQLHYDDQNPSETLNFWMKAEDLKKAEMLSFSSSDPDVCSIALDVASVKLRSDIDYFDCAQGVPLTVKKTGIVTITAKLGDKEYPIKVIIHPELDGNINTIERISYNTIRITWTKIEGASGYVVFQKNTVGGSGRDVWQPAAEINDVDTLSADIEAKINCECTYIVCPKVKSGETEYTSGPPAGQEAFGWYGKKFKPINYGKQKLTSVSAAGTDISIQWNPDPYVTSYEVYVRKSGEISWNIVCSETDPQKAEYVMMCEPGNGYDIRVNYVYPDEIRRTKCRSVYVMKDSQKNRKRVKIHQWDNSGQYGGNWASPDTVYYYQKGQELHVVSVRYPKLLDYQLDEQGKIVSQKKVSLGSYERWGGFHYGVDGNYYVAVGYDNPKRKRTKTVIKVIKYSSDWKILGVCRIKGGAGNSFPGITVPFDAGNCKMETFGENLYLFTCREMFNGHQSNIAFMVNTNNMTYNTANYNYTSHSFNQFVKYDNGMLYLSNHGDAYPRAVNLTMAYVNTKNEDDERDATKVLFRIKGKTGANYTGLEEGGMETTQSHVLIAGTSLPQDYTVAGVTGNKGAHVRNVYLLTCNKNTRESKITWLTQYHPKKSKVSVGEVRMVKMSDDYVILLYSTSKKGKSTMHYVVLNENGEVVYTKEYKDMAFYADTQPILYQGSVVWTESDGSKTFLYKIPAKIAE